MSGIAPHMWISKHKVLSQPIMQAITANKQSGNSRLVRVEQECIRPRSNMTLCTNERHVAFVAAHCHSAVPIRFILICPK